MTAAQEWQGAYAVQVYNAQNVKLNNFTGKGADAALLVNASNVELTGTTTVSGNEFGGIEVSKGDGEVLSNSILNVTGDLVNTTERNGQPTIWLVNGQGTVEGNVPTISNTSINPDQTQYYLRANELETTADVADMQQLKEALANEEIETINLTEDIAEVSESITINRGVTINGNGHTIKFANSVVESGIIVMSDHVTIVDLKVEMEQVEGWQGVYAIQVYNAQSVKLNDFTGRGADAALLVNASTVNLTGTTTVSGNEFGGIEVSKGAGEGLADSGLNVSGSIANEDEVNGEPTIWLVHNQDAEKTAQGTVSGDLVNAMNVKEIVKENGEKQTHYFLNK